jgi:hypothetical protein
MGSDRNESSIIAEELVMRDYDLVPGHMDKVEAVLVSFPCSPSGGRGRPRVGDDYPLASFRPGIGIQ